MKIVDTTKDTCITYLLKQVDACLDSLAHVQDRAICLALSFHAQTKRSRNG